MSENHKMINVISQISIYVLRVTKSALYKNYKSHVMPIKIPTLITEIA